MTHSIDNESGKVELSEVNKGFVYDEETSIEGATDKKVYGTSDTTKAKQGLNYDVILDEIGQFGR